MSAAAIVAVVLLGAIVAPLVLYGLVRSEHDRREVMDRTTAERTARRDHEDE